MIYRNIHICSIILLALVSCDRTRSSTGWDYMPDMYYSNAYESYTTNPNFADGLTMRAPVEGTVPRDMEPFPWKKTDEDRISAGEALVNPWGATEENLASGKVAYGIYCLSCHGDEGLTEALRTTHPERINCEQCHVPDTGAEF